MYQDELEPDFREYLEGPVADLQKLLDDAGIPARAIHTPFGSSATFESKAAALAHMAAIKTLPGVERIGNLYYEDMIVFWWTPPVLLIEPVAEVAYA